MTAQRREDHNTHGDCRNRAQTAARALRVGLSVTAGLLLTGGRVSAHGEEDYPAETIPEKAQAIIEDTATGGSTTLIYAGIGGLVAAGVAVYLYNLARGRRSRTSTATESVGTSANNGVNSGDAPTDDRP